MKIDDSLYRVLPCLAAQPHPCVPQAITTSDSPAIPNDLVKAVYFHVPDKSSGHRVQEVEISYDLIGILPASLLLDIQNGKTA